MIGSTDATAGMPDGSALRSGSEVRASTGLQFRSAPESAGFRGSGAVHIRGTDEFTASQARNDRGIADPQSFPEIFNEVGAGIAGSGPDALIVRESGIKKAPQSLHRRRRITANRLPRHALEKKPSNQEK